MAKKIAIYPGTFDPITYGHIDVIQKALKIFDLSENDIILSTIENNEFLIKGNKINKIDIHVINIFLSIYFI